MIYSILRPLLFCLSPETSHHLSMQTLKWAYRCGLSAFFKPPVYAPREIMGLTFPNPVGLAAGLDKNGDYIDALATLGFGFIEIGTITPKPQSGNPRPRLFRLPAHQAIINRMGFNNKGMEHAAHQLAKMRYRGILGINISKNKETPLDRAADDYVLVFRRLWTFASYITINISSPNTPGLRQLIQEDHLSPLLTTLKKEQQRIAQEQGKYVPLAIKISPDLCEHTVKRLADILLTHEIDAVVATNTTITRHGVEDSPLAREPGGLSGQPLEEISTHLIEQLHTFLQGRLPILASGGVMSTDSAQKKWQAGASLIQLYTGLIYAGPALVRDIAALGNINL